MRGTLSRDEPAESNDGAWALPGRPDDDGQASPPGIEVRGVAHRYPSRTGPVEALLPIDLRIARGEFVAIVGPSGCGKTTLLRLLCGLLEPTTGQVSLAGQSPLVARRRRAI